MIVPPTHSERGAASSAFLVEVERVLLDHGHKIVSSGLTARAVTAADSGTGDAVIAAFSDIERALLVARTSDADALLQIIDIDWHPRQRFFQLVGASLKEVATAPPMGKRAWC